MNIKILPSADADLVNGYHFYEAQAQGLGGYFRDSLFSDIDSLMIYHGIHAQCFGKYYKMLSKRFPFAIYYTIEGHDIVVYSILDCRRSPAWIKGRLDK